VATTAVAAALTLERISPRLSTLLVAAALLEGAAQGSVGVHYLTDVVGGVLGSLICRLIRSC
jgi:membrane-associated phospholipid phosphatase